MSFISWIIAQIATMPPFFGFICLTAVLVWGLIISMVIIAIVQAITDAFDIDYVWTPVRIYHFVFVFPIMLFFVFVQFGIQKREKITFYFLVFSNWEQKIIKRWGYGVEEESYTWEGKNVFGGPTYGVAITTTLYNKDN